VTGELLGHPRPHRGERLIAGPAHHDGRRLCLLTALDLVGGGVELDVLERPARVAVARFPAGCLDDAVEGDKGGGDQVAHGCSLVGLTCCRHCVERETAEFDTPPQKSSYAPILPYPRTSADSCSDDRDGQARLA